MHEQSTVTVPRWVLMLFTVLQPVIASAIVGGVALMWSMNQQVTVLSVKMEHALATEGKFETLRDQVNLLSMRVARMEGKDGPPASDN